jgi:signal peptidase II
VVRLIVMAGVLLSCVGCDQVSKLVAQSTLKSAGVISFWGDLVRLSYTENTGAFLGFGSAWPEPWRWLAFTLVATLVVIASLWWLAARVFAPPVRRFSFAEAAMLLIAAGGIGNLVDRVLRDGRVIDFLNLGVGSLRTGIFNVADVQIMVGLFMLMFSPPASEQRSRA